MQADVAELAKARLEASLRRRADLTLLVSENSQSSLSSIEGSSAMGFECHDFVAVGELAFKVFGRCKTSDFEWRGLSREVDSMLIVLDEISAYWKEQQSKGVDFTRDHKERLGNQAEACEKVLRDLLALLDKIQRLRSAGDASWKARAKFVAKDIGPTRNRLILRTTLLSTLSVTITAGSAANDQAKLLQALNIIHRDHEAGNRLAPAFAQATSHELDTNVNNVWGDIFLELQAEGVKSETINSHYEFVRNWVDRVILEEIDDDQDEIISPISPTWPLSLHFVADKELTVAKLDWSSPEASQRGNSDPSRPQTSRKNTNASRPSTSRQNTNNRPGISRHNTNRQDKSLARADSNSSHASKYENWRPVDGPNPEYVQKLLKKALCFDESASKDRKRTIRIAKRIFHQLDWSDRDFLYHHTVDETCRDAVAAASMTLSDKDRFKLISEADKNSDGRFDREEFISVVESLIKSTKGRREEELDLAIETNINRGRARHKNKVADLSKNALMWNWTEAPYSPAQRDSTHYLFPGRLGEFLQRKERPVATEDSFTVMCSLTSLCFIPLLDRILQKWSTHLMRDQFEMYRVPIDNVMAAASKFVRIAHYSVSPDALSEFDVLNESGRFCHATLASNVNMELLNRLREFKEECFGVILACYGFIDALNLDQYLNQPPPVNEWQNLRMDERSLRIIDLSNICFGRGNDEDDVAKECKSWLRAPSYQTFSNILWSGILSATKLRSEQLEREEARLQAQQQERAASRVVSRAKITFDLDGAVKLPKMDVLGRRLPNASAEIQWDEDKGDQRPLTSSTHTITEEASKTCNPTWNCEHNGYVNADTIITVKITTDRNLVKEKPIGISTIRVGNFAKLDDLTAQEGEVPIFSINKDGETGDAIPGARLSFSIHPYARPVKPIKPLPRAVESLPALMEAINSLPLPPRWSRKTTMDRRVYFTLGAHECTIAHRLPQPPDFEKIAAEQAEQIAVEETTLIANKKIAVHALPAGWQRKRAPNGRIFFVDSNTRSTGWIDPRCPSYGKYLATKDRLGTEMGKGAVTWEGVRVEDGEDRSTPQVTDDEVLKGLKAASSALQLWV